MASEVDVTSDSLDVIVTDVPENLQGYVKTKVAEYITQSKDVSMKIHQVQGQSPKLVITFGSNTGRGTQIPSGNELTRTIFVRNIPESATEDLLEAFFESKRKYGGGPVKSVKIMKDKKIAIVEFCDASSVDEVLKKKPIMLGTTELDVTPFKLLLSGNDHITQADVKGINLPKDFTENLLRNHSEYSDPSYDRELAAKITPLTRVVRGRDWCHGSQTASQALVVPGQEPLTATMLAAAPLPEQKQMLGERLFPLIQRMHPDRAAKITGMLLEIDNSKLLHMLESTESLKAKVEEAVVVLQARQAKESAHQQAAAAVKKE